MKLVVDVGYGEDSALVAGVVFSHWEDPEPTQELCLTVGNPASYVPGQFYQRELPCILQLLSVIDHRLDYILVDGHAWLPGDKPGLGAHLYQQLEHKIPVIGVAKTSFCGSTNAVHLFRGRSQRPLYITAAGLPAEDAARFIQSMHGDYRLPTLIKRVDAHTRQTKD